MDLDGTMWDNLDISAVPLPYLPDGEGQIANPSGVRVKAFPEAVSFVKWARASGATTATLSWNERKNALEALKRLDLEYLFDYDGIDPEPDKFNRAIRIMREIRSRGTAIAPERVVYVDDRDIHLEDMYRHVGKILFIHIWKEIRNFDAAKRLISVSLVLG